MEAVLFEREDRDYCGLPYAYQAILLFFVIDMQVVQMGTGDGEFVIVGSWKWTTRFSIKKWVFDHMETREEIKWWRN